MDEVDDDPKASNESGIESGNSNSSVEEYVNKPIVTGSMYIKPQTSTRSSTFQFPIGENASIDIIVIFRGFMALVPPVPADKFARMRTMKLYAKSLQYEAECRFVRMHIDEKLITLFPLVIQNWQHLSCKYLWIDGKFSTEPNGGTIGNYTCYAFHGNSPRSADQAFHVIRHLIEEQNKKNYYAKGLVPMIPDEVVVQSSEKNYEAIDLSKTTNEVQESNNPFNLLLDIDETPMSNVSTDLSIFDQLSINNEEMKTKQSNLESKNNLFILEQLMSPKPEVNCSTFSQQHALYSFNNNHNQNSLPFTPMDQVLNQKIMAPSLSCESKASQPNPSNPFLSGSQIAPPVVLVQPVPLSQQAPMKPMSLVTPTILPTASSNVVNQSNNSSTAAATTTSNQFQSIQPSTFPQYMIESNPFVSNANVPQATSSNDSNMFGDDFNSFLSKTVKGHFIGGATFSDKSTLL
ncbi:hypothetical protein RDWZM_006837 [Blomia tropicalis]|uniref:Uncharacterized protein n=1 Tax=Blomia tropicalis TaxID=40697 RepID=A0A9Q0M891_BLOTA|nr:hypothetical protein RDWZM_006837 [Blomia tropicalis]